MPGLLSCAVPSLFALCLPLVLALPNGSPLSACTSLMPSHSGISPQTSASPHTIIANCDNGIIKVMMMGPSYGGLLLQGRAPNTTVAVGNWTTPPANTKAISCFGTQNSAITHSSTTAKTANTIYTWNPPPMNNSVGYVEFVATVAQSRSMYWINLRSAQIKTDCSGAVRTFAGFAMVVMSTLVWLAAF
ncbi:putative defense protein 3 isoform X1 [Leucoraja erinacea]|uniref:putative defense protein 3 isoform X1 n=1 Tax=Leucoraja erinaceus TaxID=7782 RepID=UPI002455F8B8|nr:putative defense protein 3 isoform X1 [Leucoraja erinacea]